jgi:hypothetical protein
LDGALGRKPLLPQGTEQPEFKMTGKPVCFPMHPRLPCQVQLVSVAYCLRHLIVVNRVIRIRLLSHLAMSHGFLHV